MGLDYFYPRLRPCMWISDQNKNMNVTRLPGLLAIPKVFKIILND